MENDNLGDRIKSYEMMEAGRKLLPLLPIMIRLDGKAFHSFTRGMDKPYDIRMSKLMIETTKHLIEESNAVIGYTQSDEISLILYSDKISSQVFFDGRIQKLTSVLASMATSKFMHSVFSIFPERFNRLPSFDCRVWNVPNKVEAVNTLIWRELDASKNSVSMAGRAFFSHNELNNKNSDEIQEMLFKEHKINWNDYPSFFKRGTYIQRRKIIRKFTCDEIDKLPLKHMARNNPDLMIERADVVELELDKLSTIENRIEVVFEGKDPIYIKENKEEK